MAVMLFFNILLIVVNISIYIIANIIGSKISSNYGKYSNIENKRKITSCEIATNILNYAGISKVKVKKTLTNECKRFDPKKNTINLLYIYYDKPSLIALGVAVHEVGHVILYAEDYSLFKIRIAAPRIVTIFFIFTAILLLFGFILNCITLCFVIFLFIWFVIAFILQIASFVTEFNAGKKALAIVKSEGMLDSEDIFKLEKVIKVISINQFLRFFAVFFANSRELRTPGDFKY